MKNKKKNQEKIWFPKPVPNLHKTGALERTDGLAHSIDICVQVVNLPQNAADRIFSRLMRDIRAHRLGGTSYLPLVAARWRRFAQAEAGSASGPVQSTLLQRAVHNLENRLCEILRINHNGISEPKTLNTYLKF